MNGPANEWCRFIRRNRRFESYKGTGQRAADIVIFMGSSRTTKHGAMTRGKIAAMGMQMGVGRK